MGDNVHPPEDKSIEALEKRERAMSTLIQNLPGMAYRCRNDEAWTMDYFSEGCLEVTGRPPDEFVGNRLLSYGDIIVPEDVDYVWREVQAALDEQRAYTLEYRITDPAGDIRWVWERGRQVDTEPDGTAVLEGFITEVTARKEAEAELHELNATLERKIAARTEELEVANEQLLEHDRLKSLFLASMSHELRTPLNSIIGFTGVILQGLSGEVSPEQRTQLEMVSRSADHLLALINEVLDISRIETDNIDLEIEEFDLVPVVGEVVESFRPEAEHKGLDVAYDAPSHLRITTDPRRVSQVVMNLVGNAVKFTEAGAVGVEVRTDGDRVTVSVSDTGRGIPREEMSLLFQPFSRVSVSHPQETEGTGLGLYLSDRIAALLDGRVDVQSEPGIGSTFTFSLPAHPLPAHEQHVQ